MSAHGYTYDHARQPPRPDLVARADRAAAELAARLASLDVGTLPISDYNRRYLSSHLASLRATLQKYAYILAWSLAPSARPPEEQVFLDYGGGTGLLSLLAVQAGVGTVVYNDIYDVSCADAEQIGRALGLPAAHYVPGDVADVVAFLRGRGLSCDAAASFDVIEHVYDIDAFLRTLPALSDGPLTLFMASGANEANPFIRRAITRRQAQVEHRGREVVWGHKERDCAQPYRQVRADMVRERAPSLSDAQVERLADATRGMARADVERAVDRVLAGGPVPEPPAHATNTCDPFTGNWEEHFMDPFALAEVLRAEGFETRVMPGYWGRPRSDRKRPVSRLLNVAIRALGAGRAALAPAPWYTLYAHRASGPTAPSASAAGRAASTVSAAGG